MAPSGTAGAREEITSQTVPPTITSPSATGAA